MKPNPFVATFLALGLLAAPLVAQEEAAQPSVEEVQTYIKELNEYIEAREDRVTRLVNRILASDLSIQTAVNTVLKKLGPVGDNVDTGTRVSNVKRDVIERLKKAAEAYARQRDLISEELRHTGNTYERADLFKTRGALDGRINDIVNQAVGLALTMQTHEEHEKYITEQVNWGWGWHGDNIVKNPEWTQARREGQRARQATNDMDRALAESADRIDRARRNVEEQLRNPAISEEQRAALTEELQRWENLLSERERQMGDLVDPEQIAEPTQEVTRQDVIAGTEMIELIADGARRDFDDMIDALTDLRAELKALGYLKERLDFSANWLKQQGGQ